MFCQKCGKQIPDNSPYCPSCGYRFSPPPPGQPTPPPAYIQYAQPPMPIKKKPKLWLIPVIAVPVLVVILFFLLIISGSDSSEQPPVSKPPIAAETQTESIEQTTTPKPTAEPTKEPEISESIEETVILDKDGIKVTLMSLEDDPIYGKRIKVLVENNTDRNITFYVNNCDVNGYTMYGLSYISVAAGMKTNDYINFDGSDLKQYGIDHIAWVKCYDAKIHDSDTYDDICAAPFEISTEYANEYTPKYEPKGVQVVSTDEYEIYVSDRYNDFWGTSVSAYVINKTDKDIIVQSDNFSINGFTITDWMYDDVLKNTARYCDVHLSETDMETNGITELETATFTIEIMSQYSYDTLYVSDKLEIDFTE